LSHTQVGRPRLGGADAARATLLQLHRHADLPGAAAGQLVVDDFADQDALGHRPVVARAAAVALWDRRTR
jgi:hypothetical protein